MQLLGGMPSARLFLALCVWRLVPRREAAGTDEVVFGQVGGSILLLCRNVSKEATEVVWFQGDPHSFPPLFSSRVSFPPDVRFSLVDNSSLSITELRVQDEGNYTCREVLNKTDHEHRVQLLVANPPQATPKCWAETSSSGLMLQLFCSWPGGYPHPTLHWREEGQDLENSSWVISSTSSSDTHVETLNSSHLAHRKVFKCVGSHVVKQEQPACTVEIKLPSLESDPPQTCFVGDNVTLTCRVTESTPAARLSWLRDITQPEVEIQPGGRFLIAQEGNVSRLTIQNCSQGTDGGCYVCKAQNPVGLRELFVCLTVKQPVNIVGVVGAVVVLSILAVLTVTGVVLYYNPLLCLRGAAFRNADSGDVLVLVDSEDDEEGKGSEEALSSCAEHEAMSLVSGSRAQAAHLNHLMEGDDDELHGGVSPQQLLRRPLGEEEARAEMDSELEERLRATLRDKLRLLTVSATLPPSTRVLLKRREVAEVERELQNQRQEFQQRMERLAQRRQQLARRQEQHWDAVLRFESFLKAVAARRERALRRADEERARAAAERDEAARLQRELEQLLRHRERLARRLRSLRPFGDYLRDVLARMGQFQDVPAMLGHFGMLEGMRAALAREAEAGQKLVAQGRAQLQRYRQDTGIQLLGTRNELARLHARLEVARQDVLQWESCWSHIQSTATQKTLLLGQIKLAVLNLFQQTTAQLRIPMDRAQEDTKAQLDMVLLCIQGLADICTTGTHP
ncbi:hypothetical protein HGM15179_016545 [Zosterops borbonicus]|uniref:Ig-like domain-containing protein n=1 Tax=Zosterops borbonicus TaxID=364589 RepID=A0A8K1G2E8_9PASS|nr:hypothetical protein HGM15179_016545 [Zosterops borbonicus]